MSLFQKITATWWKKVRAEDLAEQIAGLHWRKVWERLSDQVWKMSRHERRGYIRARGALLVQQAVERVIQQRGLRHSSLTKLYALTMDQVVIHIVGHMAESLPQSKARRHAA